MYKIYLVLFDQEIEKQLSSDQFLVLLNVLGQKDQEDCLYQVSPNEYILL